MYFSLQKAARDAIKKANEDISTAKADLEEVIFIKSYVHKNILFWNFFYLDQHRDKERKRKCR
jgi:hypothetical protein